jgi:uncharacterized protein (TIGR00297 family)
LIGSSFATSVAWLAIASLVSAAIVVAAWRLKALTASGAIAAFFVGVACLGCGGLRIAAPLIAFFLSGTLLSRAHFAHPGAFDDVQQKRGARDAVQVLANGGAAAACAVAASLLSRIAPGFAPAWYAASVGAIAVAAADTWATEIGARSSTPPRSIATGRVVRPGVSGGVTPLGLLASIGGAVTIGVAAAAFSPEMRSAAWIAAYAAIGFVGAAFDSVLGGTLQGAWHCDQCDEPCETDPHRCGSGARLVRGWSWLDNDDVNALVTIAGALLGFAASAFVA